MNKRIKEIRFNLAAWLVAGNMFVIFRFFGMYDFEQYFILKVLKVNVKAKAFYERIGFKVFGETEQHFQMIYNFSAKW